MTVDGNGGDVIKTSDKNQMSSTWSNRVAGVSDG